MYLYPEEFEAKIDCCSTQAAPLSSAYPNPRYMHFLSWMHTPLCARLSPGLLMTAMTPVSGADSEHKSPEVSRSTSQKRFHHSCQLKGTTSNYIAQLHPALSGKKGKASHSPHYQGTSSLVPQRTCVNVLSFIRLSRYTPHQLLNLHTPGKLSLACCWVHLQRISIYNHHPPHPISTMTKSHQYHNLMFDVTCQTALIIYISNKSNTSLVLKKPKYNVHYQQCKLIISLWKLMVKNLMSMEVVEVKVGVTITALTWRIN